MNDKDSGYYKGGIGEICYLIELDLRYKYIIKNAPKECLSAIEIKLSQKYVDAQYKNFCEKLKAMEIHNIFMEPPSKDCFEDKYYHKTIEYIYYKLLMGLYSHLSLNFRFSELDNFPAKG